MLKVFYGTDRTKVRDAAQVACDLVVGVQTIIDDSSYEPGQLSNALGANSLFGGEQCFVLDTPSGEEVFFTEVLASLKEMAESQNTFIVLEGGLLADPKKKYAKHANEIAEFSLDKVERFNAFGLAEALAKKDKKNLWVLLSQARANNLRDEEIVGMLWWQLKSLRLAKLTRTAEEAGMKSFPYDKAKRALSGFKDGEVEALSRSLLELYHDGHQGLRDMDLALEEWVLKV
jgi:DNA polymerase III delta subunit